MFYRQILDNLKKGSCYDSIVIEGCSGCGKSTLMGILEEDGYNAFPESVQDNYLLDKYFLDKTKYSFPLQILFLNRRFEHIKQIQMTSKCLLDRSIYCDVIFAKFVKDNNEMSNEEFEVYLELYKNLLSHCYPPKLIIYLESSIEGVINRIKGRGRDYEQNVDTEYWENLLKNYNEYFDQYNSSKVLRINVDKYNFADNLEDRKYVKNLIISAYENI